MAGDAAVQQRVCDAAPGRIGQAGRRNYGLHERVVPLPEHPQVQEKVLASRQHVQEHYRPDVLGLRGAQWSPSVHTFAGKQQQVASDERLSNTLHTTHIQSVDLRRTHGATHSPTRRLQAPQLDRNLPQAHPADLARSRSASPAALAEPALPWNASTTVERREMLKGVEHVTQQSLKATHVRTQQLLPGGKGTTRVYQAPIELSALVAVRQRELKAKQLESSQALERMYGEEGAATMRATMKLPAWQRQQAHPEEAAVRRRRVGRGVPSPADLAAVAALPEDLVPARVSSALEEDGEGDLAHEGEHQVHVEGSSAEREHEAVDAALPEAQHALAPAADGAAPAHVESNGGGPLPQEASAQAAEGAA